MHTISRAVRLAWLVGLALLLVGLGYSNTLVRGFAADDYEWLLRVRGHSFGGLLLAAFDPWATHHFYRPLVWLLTWAEVRLFGLQPAGFHLVSLGLHVGCALLAGRLALLLLHGRGASPTSPVRRSSWLVLLIVAVIILMHPAPFEAVVWIAAQSELLSAFLLLLMLNLWMADASWASWLALIVYGAALLTKESTILGLPLLVLLGGRWHSRLVLPLLMTLAYLVLQWLIGQQNRVLQAGEYGIGMHLLTNPLRSLGLIVLPLAGSEHGDAAWLIPAGLVVLLGLFGLGLWAWNNHQRPIVQIILALLLSLLPTAPFVSPPDSRYLYLPVVLLALLGGVAVGVLQIILRSCGEQGLRNKGFWRGSPSKPLLAQAGVVVGIVLVILALGEVRAREERFAVASGSGASLWQLAGKICQDVQPARMLLVDPPLLPAHAEAIVALRCQGTPALILGRAQVEQAALPGSVIIAFPGGSAVVERWVD